MLRNLSEKRNTAMLDHIRYQEIVSELRITSCAEHPRKTGEKMTGRKITNGEKKFGDDLRNGHIVLHNVHK
jgi:hypothetical protein